MQVKCGIGASLCAYKTYFKYCSTIIANIEVCFTRMQCVIEELICIFKTFLLNYKFLYCFNYLLFFYQKLVIYPHRVER